MLSVTSATIARATMACFGILAVRDFISGAIPAVGWWRKTEFSPLRGVLDWGG